MSAMRSSKLAVLTAAIVCLLCGLAQGATIFVKADATGANNGTSWTDAFTQVQPALNAAVSGDEVWVAAGTYVENITLKDGVGLYGGFAGNETDIAQRNWNTNKTILDGNQTGSVVTSVSGDATTTRIDGFTVRNGKATSGGGIYCYYSLPTIANNTIVGNTASSGGGIYCHTQYLSPTIVNNTITGNTASNSGGGIYCYTLYSSPTIANNTITGNSTSGSGGGIYCYFSSPLIANNTIVANSATSGGGICCESSSAMIASTIVAFNSSGICRTVSGTPSMRRNCVFGNPGYNYSGITDPTGTNGNIAVDPELAGVAHGNTHIQPDSPCVDAGDDSFIQPAWTDADGQPRKMGAHVDIGADESDGTAWSRGPYTIVRVAPEGNDADDGSSWALAKRTVQGGINAASVSGGDVWVKAGTYPERIALGLFAHVYGGFSGTEERRDQRDSRLNATILDGQQGGSVVSARAGYRINTIDGFTIRNGSGTVSAPSCFGGGVYCWLSSPAIANNRIVGNTGAEGGGIYSYYAFPTIAGNTITGNTASGSTILISGAGICCYGGAPTIANNVITGNTASGLSPRGCGIYCSSSSPTIANNTVTSNSLSWTSSPGGAIHCTDSSATIVNTIISFNSAGIYKNGPGTLTLGYNCVYGNTEYNYSGFGDPTGTNGNLSADPEIAGWKYGHWHIRASSPCAGAGSSALLPPDTGDVDGDGNTTEPLPFDLDGQPRIQGQDGAVDIGADESDGTDPAAKPNVIVRVSSDGDDANDGSSWALAKRTVQAGINASVLGGEVWVKAGTYPERITLRVFAHVYGGFGGTEETREQRDCRSNLAILDGEKGGSVVTARLVGYGAGTVDGFTITNGSGGGVHCTDASPVIVNNTITGNTASSAGGGIGCHHSSPMIANNTIAANTALDYGGGIYCTPSRPKIVNNRIIGNIAGHGGGIYCNSSSPMIANNTITRNIASGQGGAIHCGSSSPIIANTIVAFNSSGVYRSGTSAQVLQYNCVFGNTAYNYSGLTDPTGTNGNISSDPLFMRPATPGADGQWGTLDDDYGDLRLQPDSPCIDAGDNAAVSADVLDLDGDGNVTEPMPFDLAGGHRFFDVPFVVDTGLGTPPIVDMGAYEYAPTAPADFDLDGDVDSDDLTAFNACASGPGVPRSAACAAKDFDLDNDVDQADFGLFQRCLSGSGVEADLNCAE